MESTQPQSPDVSAVREDVGYSPIAKLQRVWMIAEKVSVSASILLVVCTIGYLSMHALA